MIHLSRWTLSLTPRRVTSSLMGGSEQEEISCSPIELTGAHTHGGNRPSYESFVLSRSHTFLVLSLSFCISLSVSLPLYLILPLPPSLYFYIPGQGLISIHFVFRFFILFPRRIKMKLLFSSFTSKFLFFPFYFWLSNIDFRLLLFFSVLSVVCVCVCVCVSVTDWRHDCS